MLSIIEAIAGRPWAIRADIAAHIHAVYVREGLAGLRALAGLKGAVHAFDEPKAAAARGRSRTSNTVGVVPIVGVMTQRGDVINSAETRSTASIAEEVSAMAADPKVDGVVLDVDSPGGEVFGVPEAWEAIRAASKIKPVVAVANAQMASAALYLGSAASEIIVTPSGEIGSLGVYALHVDESQALAAEGLVPQFVVADESPFKVEGNPFEPLSDDARSEIKKSVNRYMTMFIRDVAKGRAVSVDAVRRDFGRGRMLGPQEAVAVKMADSVGTLEDGIRRAAQLGRERRRKMEDPGYRAEKPETLVLDPAIEIPEPNVEAMELTDEQRAALRQLMNTL